MKLKAAVFSNEHEISLDLVNGGTVAEVDGRHHELEVRDSDHGNYLIMEGQNVYKCRVEARREAKDSFAVVLRGQTFDVTIVDPKRLRSGHTSGGQAHGSAEIVSPMPGKIVRVLVERGAQVEAGAGIVVVEAMKMQNEMKAPKAGLVASINVEAGATVNAGDVLAVVE